MSIQNIATNYHLTSTIIYINWLLSKIKLKAIKKLGINMNKELIIFDMDGTLLDSAPSLAYAINYMLRSVSKSELSLERIRQFIGKGSEILAKKAYLNKHEFSDDEIDKEEFKKAHKIFLDFYGKNLNAKTKLYPNAIETLEKLNNLGYITALVTNKPHQFVKPMLEHFKLDKHFKDYLGASEKFAKKPAPDMLLHICEKFNVEPKDAVMVGDSANDVLAAKAANIDSIAVTYGYYGGDIRELNPTVTVDNLTEILKVLNG